MEDCEKTIISENIDRLVKNTICNVTLLVALQASKILHEADIEELNTLEKQKGKLAQTHRFYNILQTRQDGFQKLLRGLQETNQTGAVAILNAEIAKRTITGLGDSLTITYDPNVVLGRGSCGTVVYKGTFENRDVAVKRVLPDLSPKNPAVSEKEVLKLCDEHENIVRYYGSKQDQNYILIVLELCDKTLKQWTLDKCTDISPVEILRQITAGLEWLHANDVVHRDLKPENILLTKHAGLVKVKISDFGLSRRIMDGRTGVSTAAVGTNGWIAPEILQTKTKFTFASDVFALGCVFYYVLTDGQHAFGDQLRRQVNIVDGRDLLDANQVLHCCNQHLAVLKLMVANDPKLRPSCYAVGQLAPIFWSEKRRIRFINHLNSAGELLTKLDTKFSNQCVWRHDIELSEFSKLGLQPDKTIACMITSSQCEWARQKYFCNSSTMHKRTLPPGSKNVNSLNEAQQRNVENVRPTITSKNSVEFTDDILPSHLNQLTSSTGATNPCESLTFCNDNSAVNENTSHVTNHTISLDGNTLQTEGEHVSQTIAVSCLSKPPSEEVSGEVNGGPGNSSVCLGAPLQLPSSADEASDEVISTSSQSLEASDQSDDEDALLNEAATCPVHLTLQQVEPLVKPSSSPESTTESLSSLESGTNFNQETTEILFSNDFKQLDVGTLDKIRRSQEIVMNESLQIIKTELHDHYLTKVYDKDNGHKSLLHVAVEYRGYDVVEYLVEALGFSDVLANERFDDLIHVCIQNVDKVETDRFIDICKSFQLLVSKRPDIIECREPILQQTPFHVATMDVFQNGKQLEFIEMLIKNRADINAKDHNHQTPLHLVATRNPENQMEIVKLLVDNEADPDAVDNKGKTILHIAASNATSSQFHEIVAYLVSITKTECFSIVDLQGYTALHIAVQYFEPQETTLEIFKLQGFNFKCVDKNGNSIVTNAIKGGRTDTFFKLLFKYGVDSKLLNTNQDTKLHYAALYGNLPALDLFISCGSDVNATNLAGNTPLHRALQSNGKNVHGIVSKILAHKANVHIKNNNGELPIDIAMKRVEEKNQKQRTVELLKHTARATQQHN